MQTSWGKLGLWKDCEKFIKFSRACGGMLAPGAGGGAAGDAGTAALAFASTVKTESSLSCLFTSPCCALFATGLSNFDAFGAFAAFAAFAAGRPAERLSIADCAATKLLRSSSWLGALAWLAFSS